MVGATFTLKITSKHTLSEAQKKHHLFPSKYYGLGRKQRTDRELKVSPPHTLNLFVYHKRLAADVFLLFVKAIDQYIFVLRVNDPAIIQPFPESARINSLGKYNILLINCQDENANHS